MIMAIVNLVIAIALVGAGFVVGMDWGLNFATKRIRHPRLKKTEAAVDKTKLIHKETIRVYSDLNKKAED